VVTGDGHIGPGAEPGGLASVKARRESKDRRSRGRLHFDIENHETPTEAYDCGHIGTSHMD
jgi:hypothetical protein